MIRIVNWNINSIRLRLDLITKIQNEFNPDIIMLQETKVDNSLFPKEACNSLSFPHLYYEGGKSYNGVAILSKIPFNENFSLEFYNNDKRHIAVKIGDVEIHNFYVPAGGDIPDPELNPKFKHKLAYLEHMREWFNNNRKPTDKIILAGDLNIAPLEHDVWSSKQLRNVVSHTNVERKAMMQIINEFCWIDLARKFVPIDQKLYSWWSYRNKDWEKSNRGRRLDHIWTSQGLENSCSNFQIIKDVRRWSLPSDHVPVIADFNIKL